MAANITRMGAFAINPDHVLDKALAEQAVRMPASSLSVQRDQQAQEAEFSLRLVGVMSLTVMGLVLTYCLWARATTWWRNGRTP